MGYVSKPFDAEATFVKGTRLQKILKAFWTMSCWYSLESSCWAQSDECPFPWVSVIFSDFFSSFSIDQISHQQHKVQRSRSFLEGHAVSVVMGRAMRPCGRVGSSGPGPPEAMRDWFVPVLLLTPANCITKIFIYVSTGGKLVTRDQRKDTAPLPQHVGHWDDLDSSAK